MNAGNAQDMSDPVFLKRIVDIVADEASVPNSIPFISPNVSGFIVLSR
jgi:hypothetical protein